MTSRLIPILIVSAALLLWISSGQAQPQQPFPPRIPDIPYNDIDDRQTLTIYLPDERDENMPVLFLLHGGGYVFGINDIVRQAAEIFTEEGYAVVTPNYRLAPQYTYPAPINDIFCAYAWTFANAATYGFDPSRIVPMGESAGANAAALIATVEERSQFLTDCDYSLPDDYTVPGVVAYYMPVELSTCECNFAKRLGALYLGVDQNAWEQADKLRTVWEGASPLAWIDEDDPPFLLIHGTQDGTVPISESVYFVEQYEDAGGDAKLIRVDGAQHGFVGRPERGGFEETLPQVLDFLSRIVSADDDREDSAARTGSSAPAN